MLSNLNQGWVSRRGIRHPPSEKIMSRTMPAVNEMYRRLDRIQEHYSHSHAVSLETDGVSSGRTYLAKL